MKATNEMDSIYQGWTNEDLLCAAGPERHEYRPEAIQAIDAELARRGMVGADREELEQSRVVEEERRTQELTGVHGWLLLFALIVLGNSASTVIGGTRELLQNPLGGVLRLPEVAVGAYGCYVFALLMQKRRTAPKHAARWLFMAFGVTVFYAIYAYWLMREIILAPFYGVGILMWLEYLRKSRRVAATYGRQEQDVEPARGTDG
ncbi:MAG: hypothetical protein K8J08_12540 [Thermoanaerobaculia bacterium]|nr:hypothetical protein [Thermoanaerobaculia bacterium]